MTNEKRISRLLRLRAALKRVYRVLSSRRMANDTAMESRRWALVDAVNRTHGPWTGVAS